MKVKLIDHQTNALDLLLYTKATRLGGVTSLEDLQKWSLKEKLSHLAYMKETIKSSWEFVGYTFEIQGVSRNLTHQLVRTRTQSYAQESQRTVDVRDNGVLNYGKGITDYDLAVENSFEMYIDMIDSGVDVQTARGVLPTDVLTNIMVKTDLRTLHETAKVRLCKRTQGEYQEMFKLMKKAICDVHPYFENFINVACIDSGICCFPNYTDCPVQEHTVKITVGKKDEIMRQWEKSDHVANPVAKDGRTM